MSFSIIGIIISSICCILLGFAFFAVDGLGIHHAAVAVLTLVSAVCLARNILDLRNELRRKD